MEINVAQKESEVKNAFISDYEKIVNNSENTVIVKIEWKAEGDYFQKLSIYDNSYSPVITLGNTTLIKSYNK